VTRIRCYETTGRPVFITVGLHRQVPYLKKLVGQVAPQALPDAYETTEFLLRSERQFRNIISGADDSKTCESYLRC